MKRLILISAIILLVSSCSTIEPVKLPLPPPLVVPTIQPEDLSCLSDEAYDALVKRDKLKSARIQTLIDIIKSTH